MVGEVNGGWAVASRQLFHERNAVGGGSPFFSGPAPTSRRASPVEDLIGLVRRTGRAGDPSARELIAELHALGTIQSQLVDRVAAGMRSEQLPPAAGLPHPPVRRRERQPPGRDRAGAAPGRRRHARSGRRSERDIGVHFIARQGGSLGGGSTEMARNIISERILGMPREYAADRDVPFSQVKRADKTK